jgi:hypothetical protein
MVRVIEMGRRDSGGMGGVRMVLITKWRRGKYRKEKDRIGERKFTMPKWRVRILLKSRHRPWVETLVGG